MEIKPQNGKAEVIINGTIRSACGYAYYDISSINREYAEGLCGLDIEGSGDEYIVNKGFIPLGKIEWLDFVGGYVWKPHAYTYQTPTELDYIVGQIERLNTERGGKGGAESEVREKN